MTRVRALLIAGVAAVALAAAGPALAAPAAQAVAPRAVQAPTYSPDTAGYQVSGNGLTGTIQVRATVIPQIGSAADPFLLLQQSPVTGGLTAEIALIQASPGVWVPEGGMATLTHPGRLPVSDLSPLPGGATITQDEPFFIGLNYSTRYHQVSWMLGRSEFGDFNVALQKYTAGPAPVVFYGPFAGAFWPDTATLPGVADPEVAFSRVGLTTDLKPTEAAGPTNSRVPFASLSTVAWDATVNGPAPTAGNPDDIYLQPSGFGVGSSFGVGSPDF